MTLDYTVHYYEHSKDDPEYVPIDFEVLDKDNEGVAWVWGDDRKNVEVECNHPEIIFGDDDETGVCPICGADCQWHYEDLEDGSKDRVEDQWSLPFTIAGSMIEEELNDHYKNV